MPGAFSFLVSLYMGSDRQSGYDFWICACKQRPKPFETNLILCQIWQRTSLTETPGSWEAVDVSYILYMYIEKWLNKSVFSVLNSNSAYTASCYLLEHPASCFDKKYYVLCQAERDELSNWHMSIFNGDLEADNWLTVTLSHIIDEISSM